jgi:hypothetical protein
MGVNNVSILIDELESITMLVIFTKTIEIKKKESVYRTTDNTMAKRKSTKDKQRSTKHTHKTKDRVTRIPLKTGRIKPRNFKTVVSPYPPDFNT